MLLLNGVDPVVRLSTRIDAVIDISSKAAEHTGARLRSGPVYNNKNAMADNKSEAPDNSSNMKDMTNISDNIQDNSDPDEEERILDPDHVEERFRVDRRKLEQMIQQADCDLDEESAEDFFRRIMEDTNTRITWPSKLKIGAKSKKDPHIKVSGHRDAVAEAKEKIMAVLDTKSSRVTLKMDVSHTEHSHVIGKGGNNIKRVMQETGCHIHFPDSNRNTQAEKSNQVSIAGQPKGVEQARAQIRELLPLIYILELPQPMTGLLQPLPDTSSPQIQQIQTTYGVAVSFKQRTYATTVTVRGSMSNAKSVKDATAVLIEHLTGNIGRSVPVSMQLEIAPQHHLFIIGRNGGNIKQILQQTGATIRFPDPNNSVPQRKGTVYISGTIESVFLARQQLIGCLPLVLMFDMKEDTTIEQAKINQLMEQLDVYISIKPKPKQPSKSVIVKSIERNTANLYEARRRLLGLMNEAPIVTSSNQGDQMTCANRTFGSLSVLPTLLSVNTTPQVFLVNGTQSPLTSPHGNHTIGTPGLITAPTVYHPLMVLQPTPGAYAPLTAAAAYQLYHQNGITKEAAGLVQNGLNKDVIQAVSGTSKHKQTDVSMEHLAQQQKQAPRGTTGSTRVQTESPESHRHKQMYTSDRASPSSDHHSSHSASSINSSVPGSPPPTSTNGLDLISNVMSMSLLGGTSLGNLQFTKNDLQDAVSSIQSEPNLLKGLLPANSQASTDIMSMDVFGQHSSNVDSMTSGLQRPTAPSGSALNNSSSAPTRRVKTPPGFSGPPRGRSDVSPLRQLQSHYESPQTYYESSVTASNASNSPLSFSSSGSSLGLGGSTIHPRQDSPLGGLGSPLVSGGSPLGGSGSPLTTPGSPICRNHSRLFQNGETRSSESGCDSDGSDRAPGSNRPQKANPSLFSTSSMFASFDYEQKKLLATKAMQKKPEGESRIPTDFWSGLGFSKSMPDTNLRERFKSNNIRYNGPSMTTTYECVNGEESEMWADGAALAEEVAPPVGESLPSHISAAPGEFPSPRKKMSEYTSLSSSNHIDVSTVPSISHDWPPKADLTELFSKLGLGKYIDLFTQQEIDLSTFLTLTDHDLKELGISTFGARRKMLLAIADLKKQPSLMSSDMGRSGSESNSANNNNSGSAFRDGRSLPVGPRCRDIASQSGRW